MHDLCEFSKNLESKIVRLKYLVFGKTRFLNLAFNDSRLLTIEFKLTIFLDLEILIIEIAHFEFNKARFINLEIEYLEILYFQNESHDIPRTRSYRTRGLTNSN